MPKQSIPQNRDEFLEILKDNPEVQPMLNDYERDKARLRDDYNNELMDIETRLDRMIVDLWRKHQAVNHE